MIAFRATSLAIMLYALSAGAAPMPVHPKAGDTVHVAPSATHGAHGGGPGHDQPHLHVVLGNDRAASKPDRKYSLAAITSDPNITPNMVIGQNNARLRADSHAVLKGPAPHLQAHEIQSHQIRAHDKDLRDDIMKGKKLVTKHEEAHHAHNTAAESHEALAAHHKHLASKTEDKDKKAHHEAEHAKAEAAHFDHKRQAAHHRQEADGMSVHRDDLDHHLQQVADSHAHAVSSHEGAQAALAASKAAHQPATRRR